MSRFGTTWWAKRWLRTLEALGLTYPDNRMSRARSLASKEAVDLLTVEPGELSAWVDQPPRTFGVSVNVTTFDADTWRTFDTVIANRLSNLADLIDDRLPSDIDRQLEPHGLTLFPSADEIDTSCPCKDKTRVCVHVIAVHHVFATGFDDDPFLLPLLRGRDREELLSAIREAGPDRARLPRIDAEPGIDPSTLTTASFYSARGDIDAVIRA